MTLPEGLDRAQQLMTRLLEIVVEMNHPSASAEVIERLEAESREIEAEIGETVGPKVLLMGLKPGGNA